MTFLRINGWTIPVANEAASERREYVGEIDTRYNNRPSRARRAIKKTWSFTTIKLDAQCADTLEGLLKGVGHYYPFDASTWSDSGKPTIGSNFTHVTSGGAFRGSGYLDITGSTTFPVDLPPNKWTVIVARRNIGWEHIIVTSDGRKYFDGVRNDAGATTWLTVTSGSVVITDTADFDELTVYPFEVCDEFALELFPWIDGDSEVTPAMTVKADGDFNGEEIVTCVGDIDDQSYLQYGGSSWINNARTVGFRLLEE